MKFSSLLLTCLLGLFSTAHATNQHAHPQALGAGVAANYANDCEIEIINRSYEHVRVFGMFDDGALLEPFNVYSFEIPRYISLFYNGYCHQGMNIELDTFDGEYIYRGYVSRGKSLFILPYLLKKAKVELRVS